MCENRKLVNLVKLVKLILNPLAKTYHFQDVDLDEKDEPITNANTYAAWPLPRWQQRQGIRVREGPASS